MRTRWVSTLAAVAGIVVVCAVLGGSVPGLTGQVALAQPAPASPGTPGGPGSGAPGYGPGRGYGPGFGPMGAPGWDHGRFGRGGFRRGAGIAAGAFALFALLRFLLLAALLVIAWKVITLRSLWGHPDGAVQAVRERFARGDIGEEEYRKRLAALS
jgi:uncharacterized membrane protein